jgi:hypothetical protein
MISAQFFFIVEALFDDCGGRFRVPNLVLKFRDSRDLLRELEDIRVNKIHRHCHLLQELCCPPKVKKAKEPKYSSMKMEVYCEVYMLFKLAKAQFHFQPTTTPPVFLNSPKKPLFDFWGGSSDVHGLNGTSWFLLAIAS